MNKWVFSLIVSLLPVFLIQINRVFSLDKDVVFFNEENCKEIPTDGSIIDICQYDSDELIGIQYINSQGVLEGGLVRILNLEFGSPKFLSIPIFSFPTEVSFHPIAIFIEENSIYLLNQASKNGGPRIDIFNYSNHKAIYQSSTLFDSGLGETFGDFIVKHNKIYAAQYSAVPVDLSLNSSPINLISRFRSFAINFAQSYEAGVYMCSIAAGEKSSCQELNTSKSASVTGIVFNKDLDRLFLSFSSIDYNWIEVYDLGSDGNVEFYKGFPLRDKAEKLFTPLDSVEVYASVIPWPNSFRSGYPSGVAEITYSMGRSNYVHRILYMQENKFKGGNALGKLGNYAITGSSFENSVLVCFIEPNQ